MKHAIKPDRRKKIKSSVKIAAIALGVIAAAVILVLGILNHQLIYEFISSAVNSRPSGAEIEKVKENSGNSGNAEEELEENVNKKIDPEEESGKDSEPGKESAAEGEEGIDDDDKEKPEDEKEIQGDLPTIKLEIYEGPTYSSAGDVCYYRIRAIVTGEPVPVVSFSKDDSAGWLGPGRAQVNIARDTGSYTLTTVAENPMGKASETLTLAWNCNACPEIRGIVFPGGTLYAGKQYEIHVDAVDPDGDTMSYSWSTSGGVIADSSSNPIKWTAPGVPGDYTISVIASDGKGCSSETKTTTASVKAASSPVTNQTSVVGYIDVTAEQLVSLFSIRGSARIDRAKRLAPIYIKYGKMFNIRADIAWAQMCHETAFLEYTGDVRPEQNNFAGIGATGGGAPGNSFATEELGIIAHYAHLAWYYFPDHVNEYCSIQYDPRHFENRHKGYTGDTTLGFLNGRWAPGATYTDKIALFANEVWRF